MLLNMFSTSIRLGRQFKKLPNSFMFSTVLSTILCTHNRPLSNSNSYDLNNTDNVCHVDEWKLFHDFLRVCDTNNLIEVTNFHDNYVRNYDVNLRQYSKSKDALVFYDSAWRSIQTLNFDIYNRFMNYSFRKSMCQNQNVTNEIVAWFLSTGAIDDLHYHCAFNTLCHTGNLKTAKIMNDLKPIDFHIHEKKEVHLDYFRAAASCNHLEMAKWLYSLGAHKDYVLGYSNIKKIVDSYANEEVRQWIRTLQEFRD